MSYKKDNPAISLIIPVYNVESYLRKALQSVADQTMKDVEVIIVNDGSTDSSAEICKEFADKYDNFILINKENGGLSSARNDGLKIAKGEYIAFLDSDDYVSPDFLQILYDLAVNNNADISCCNCKFYFPKLNIKFSFFPRSRTKVYTKEKALKKLILDYTIHYFAWNKLCKRSIFEDNNIRFYDMCFEDISTSPRLFYNANKIAVTSKAPYYYTQRDGSILNTMNANKINDYTLALGIIRNYIQSKGEYKTYRNIIKHYGNRVRWVNYYYIVTMHLKFKTFTGFKKNMVANNKMINYFISDNYHVKGEKAELPCFIESPEKKQQNQIKTSE